MKIIRTKDMLWIFVMAAVIMLSACSKPIPEKTVQPTASNAVTLEPIKTTEPTAVSTDTPIPTETVLVTETPIINAGPGVIGFYTRTGSGYRLLPEITGKWIKGKDICDIYAIASRDDIVMGSSFKDIFETCWNQYPNADDYKIGYHLIFTLKSSEVIDMTIRSPKDAPKDPKAHFYQYVEVYMYDSLVPKDGPKRMHLVESKMKEDTIITSIKLTSGSKISEVTDIQLMVYVYKDDHDFDPVSGKYIGNVSYEIPVVNK